MFRKFLKKSSPRKELKNEIWLQLTREAGSTLPDLRRPFVFRPAFILLFCLFLIGFGTGAYAYESPDVSDGHPLYQVKRSLENMEVRVLARTPEKRAMIQLKLAERRLLEAKRRMNKTQIFETRPLENIDHELQAARRMMPSIKNEEALTQIRTRMQRVKAKKAEHIEKLLRNKQQQNKELLEKYINENMDPEELRDAQGSLFQNQNITRAGKLRSNISARK